MVQRIQLLDDNGTAIGLPPQEVATIAAATAITWKAITPATEVVISFSGGLGTEFTLAAGTTILVHPNLRLKTETVALVY